jgi:hypothetical protein
MDGLTCSRDRVSEILVRLIRRQADFVFRSHGKRSFSLYAEDRSAETVRLMVPEAKVFRHKDGTNSIWVLFNLTEVTK